MPYAFKKKKNHCGGGGVKRCRAQRTTHPRVDPRVLWPRSRDFEKPFRLTPAMVEYLAGEFYNSSIYVMEGDDPDGKGHPIPVFQKVFVLFAYKSYNGYCKSINYMNRCIIISVVKPKREKLSLSPLLYTFKMHL